MNLRTIPTCPHCGSHNVVKDATARWDIDAQAWTLSCTHDHETCEDCETSGDFMTAPYWEE